MIRLIAACDRSRGIAKSGIQPWCIPQDEAYFSEQTKRYGGSVLVGSTTFKTFHGPLTGRKNYVLTSNKTPIDGVTLVHNLDTFLKDYDAQDLWVIGGANVYTQLFEAHKVDEIYLTQIEADFDCNQFFPSFNEEFKLQSHSELHEQNGFIFSFVTYAKVID